MDDHPDYLRSVEMVCKPDRRSPTTSFLTNQPITVKDHRDRVTEYVLHNGVPEGIRMQFETTRNLYLYSWFVYRFYPVTRLHAYTCLELALRMRFESDVIASRSKPSKRQPTLKALLTHAVKNGYLKNENFSVWRHCTEMRAQQRTGLEQIMEMQRLNLKEMVIDDEAYEITDEDRNHDYLETIQESIPKLRNHHAHGSTWLDNHALGAIQLVAEIINQIYLEPSCNIS